MLENRGRMVVMTLAALAIGAALFLAGVAVGSAGGPASAEGARVEPYPDWFLPIWDAYDRNPAITPDFDFASLHAPSIARR